MESIIEEFGFKKPLDVYKFVESFDELLLVNIAFLEGRVKQSPTHFGYVNIHSNYIEKLVKINKLGFLTLEGQKSKCKYEIPTHSIFSSFEKKSYITGLMDRKYSNKLIKYMKNSNIKSKYKFYIVNHTIKYNCFRPRQLIYSTFNNFPVNLTRNKYNKNKYNLFDMEWQYYTNIYNCNTDENLFIDYPNILKIINKLVYVVITGNDYGLHSVEDLLLNFFISIM